MSDDSWEGVDIVDLDMSGEGPLSEDEAYLWGILSDRSGVDIAEFAFTDEEKPDRCFRTRGYQQVWFRDTGKFQVEMLARDLGKALAVNTPLLTDNRGWTTMGEVEVGDVVFDETGTRCNVTAVHEVLHDRPCYRLDFDDGASITCDVDHLWETISRTDGRRVITTEQLIHTFSYGGTKKKTAGDKWPREEFPNHRIECTSIVDHGDWEQRLADLQTLMDARGRTRGPWVAITPQDRHERVRIQGDLNLLGVKYEVTADGTLTWTPAGGINPYRDRAGEVPVADEVPSRYVVGWAEVPSEPVRCIEVDSPHNLFLAGTDLVPTHNSLSVLLRAAAWPFVFPGADMLITAPQQDHLKPLTEKIEYLFFHSGIRLFRETLQVITSSGKGGGLSRVPAWSLQFANNARLVTRLPKSDGKGVKGQHVSVIELDEAQDYPQPGFTEIIETLKSASEGAQWRIHGVSSGRRDMFYKFTMNEMPNLRFKVHKYPAMYRESWSEEERIAKIDLYGGREHTDYKRNVYGHHGEIRSALFSTFRLNSTIRRNESSYAVDYNRNVYTKILLTDEESEQFALQDGGTGETLRRFIEERIPNNHLSEEYTAYFAGVDVGLLRDPTELILWGLTSDREGNDLYRHLLRIKMVRVPTPDQAIAVAAVFGTYGRRLRSMGFDRNGIGLGLVQMLSTDRDASALPREDRDRIKGYSVSQKVPVAFAEPEDYGDADAVIRQDVGSWGLMRLRQLVDAGRIELPNDAEQINEWRGQSVIVSRDPGDGQLVRRGGSRISLHTLDAAMMLVAAMDLPAIEEMLEDPAQVPVLDMW